LEVVDESIVGSVGGHVKSKKPVEPLVEQFRAEPDRADSILEAFASSRSFELRSWVSGAAPQALVRKSRLRGCRAGG
jgi:hypothetical protein